MIIHGISVWALGRKNIVIGMIMKMNRMCRNEIRNWYSQTKWKRLSLRHSTAFSKAVNRQETNRITNIQIHTYIFNIYVDALSLRVWCVCHVPWIALYTNSNVQAIQRESPNPSRIQFVDDVELPTLACLHLHTHIFSYDKTPCKGLWSCFLSRNTKQSVGQ